MIESISGEQELKDVIAMEQEELPLSIEKNSDGDGHQRADLWLET